MKLQLVQFLKHKEMFVNIDFGLLGGKTILNMENSPSLCLYFILSYFSFKT